MNVDFDVYRIRTKVTEQGATIEADGTGVYVEKRNKLTRRERLERLEDDLTYTANQLDRDVVSESQIRTVLQQFRDKVLAGSVPRTRRSAEDTRLRQGRLPRRRHRTHRAGGVRRKATTSAGRSLTAPDSPRDCASFEKATAARRR